VQALGLQRGLIGRVLWKRCVVQDDGRELREARGGGGRAAETGARGAHRREGGVV